MKAKQYAQLLCCYSSPSFPKGGGPRGRIVKILNPPLLRNALPGEGDTGGEVEEMYKEHKALEKPKDNEKIWRYMDFIKFLSLLDSSALFFSSSLSSPTDMSNCSNTPIVILFLNFLLGTTSNFGCRSSFKFKSIFVSIFMPHPYDLYDYLGPLPRLPTNMQLKQNRHLLLNQKRLF